MVGFDETYGQEDGKHEEVIVGLRRTFIYETDFQGQKAENEILGQRPIGLNGLPSNVGALFSVQDKIYVQNVIQKEEIDSLEATVDGFKV